MRDENNTPTESRRNTTPRRKTSSAEVDEEFARRLYEDAEARERLTVEEVIRVRELLRQDDRVVWLWATARTWAIWITAVIAGASVSYETLIKVVKNLAGK